MTEPLAARPQEHDRRAGSLTPASRPRASYDTGESSTTGSLRNATPTTDRLPDDGLPLNSSPADGQQGSGNQSGREDRHKRRVRNRSNGTFLLQDAASTERDQGYRRQSRNMLHPKTRAAPRTPEPQKPRSRAGHVYSGTKSSSDRNSRQSTTSPHDSSGHSDRVMDDFEDPDKDLSPYQDSPSLPDLDSTQIVNMALNLSESRRLASRRNVSRAKPPQLVPLPDAPTGGSLRQHLQQQRKTSRNLSPRAGQLASPGLSSGGRANSPLRPAFDPGHDNSQYRYQFSPSTLARAQKAREHLELMAQYRQLLEMLPPLKPGRDRDTAATPPMSPIERATSKFGVVRPSQGTGRLYNPLQYIRNRKVRARERKVVDGDRQGFGDVESVKSWVEQISKQALTSKASLSSIDTSIMPPFPGADELGSQASPDSSSKTAQRSRRPRVDWFMEPCDMVADAYWLEQDSHKHLIEDRHWRKIFPPPATLSAPASRPMSGQTDDAGVTWSTPFNTKITDDVEDVGDAKDYRLTETDTGLSQGSTRERAKQKLQEFKFPHRHTGSISSHHDFLRIRRDSGSDLSGSDTEAKTESVGRSRHGRSGTISGSTNDLLEKQMLEMIAREAREKELEDVPETEAEHRDSVAIKTPERKSQSKSPDRSGSQRTSRKASVVDTSDSDHRSALRHNRRISVPAIRSGRQSLDVPDDFRRRSYEYDSSMPTSPELAASQGRGSIPAIGVDFSPTWSRAGSPTRNPISRVKQKLRERNRENANGNQVEPEDDPFITEPASPSEGIGSPDKRQSSPLRKPGARPTADVHKGHRSGGSVRLRGEDQGVGLRGMFKGPRIDTVLRGSVSKLGDMLWKKDGSSESQQDAETTDESDSDTAKKRGRSSVSISGRDSKREHDRRESKHFLDSMPQFHHAEARSKTSANDGQNSARPSISRTQSRQSRFDLLKPPRLDVRSTSPSGSPPSSRPARRVESEASDSESRRSSVPDGVRAADVRLNSVMGGLPSLNEKQRSVSRHWSITDRSPSSARTHISKREVERMRALIMSSGIKAMEISRRAYEPHKPSGDTRFGEGLTPAAMKAPGVPWQDISRLIPPQADFHKQQAVYCELYPLAARGLSMAIQASGQRWQQSADHFASNTSVDMQNRIWTTRTRIAEDLSNMTRRAADEADETSKDLALDQPLKVKHVVDIIEKMIRKRRRRFRWVRRAMWLTVEWLLIGFMWYVWFVVMILRVFFGVGKGVWTGVRWLLWL